MYNIHGLGTNWTPMYMLSIFVCIRFMGLALTGLLCIAYVEHICIYNIHGLGTNWTPYV